MLEGSSGVDGLDQCIQASSGHWIGNGTSLMTLTRLDVGEGGEKTSVE